MTNKPTIDYKLDDNGKYRYVIINGEYYDDIEDAGKQIEAEELSDDEYKRMIAYMNGKHYDQSTLSKGRISGGTRRLR